MTMSRLVIALAGVLTFVAVYFGMQALSMRPSPAPEATPAPNTVTRRIDAGDVVVALPIGAAEPLVRGLQPGARLNVLASLPDADSGRPLSAVVTRGARIVQPVTASDPLVVEVSPDDALVLAHLVLGGTQLSYAVWPGGVEPAETPPLDERTVRALLGLQPPSTPTPEPTLAPPASATPVPPAPSPTPLPPPATSTPVPVPVAPGPVADRYVVQPGDSLFGVADQLGIDRARMQTANPNVPPDGPLPPGMQLVVPQEG